MWLDKIIQIFKIRDLRKSILFVLAMLVVFRIAAQIPIPGVNVGNLKEFFASNQILGLINIFSGGAMENFSIVAMGIAPYITASIIFQLLVMIIPKLEEISKEQGGQQKINRWTRLLTVPLAALQGYGMLTLLRQQSTFDIIGHLSAFELITALVTLTAGTIFLMWIGELISEKKIGNGISLLIFAGIIAALPGAIQRTLVVFDPSQIATLIAFGAIAVITIIGVVIINEGTRNVPVSYARHIRGNRMYGGVNTHLPLRVNMAGVIPIIFAISLILFPPMVANFFLHAKSQILVKASEFIIQIFQNQLIYGILYFTFVFGFTYFYTAVVFHPQQIADNLQKQGGFIPGIRPGKNTEEYLARVTSRIILAGALFLGLIAILPLILQGFTGGLNLVIGGTSLLIVVSVVIESMKQIQAQMTMREYEGL
ncbi:MAG TPA: preprotein translocase subunit SecY [Candidatus Uhrbacteria bacterium]|nr:preprotein translocase subunit SecY [Candidatus Uhrbacteria bacterium]